MKTVIKKRAMFPKCVQQFKELKGICIGGCIDKDDVIDNEHIAHAHPCIGPHQGWVCLRYKSLLKIKLLLLHEVAHLIANQNPTTPTHGKKWKEAVVAIGGTFKEFIFKCGRKYYRNIDYTYRNRKQ